MDTSKDYYDSVMRQFRTYGQGRTLGQFCRDEGVDYTWILKVKGHYGESEIDSASQCCKRKKTKTPDLIKLHYEDNVREQEPEPIAEEKSEITHAVQDNETWMIASLRLVTPGGEEIEITTSKPSAVSDLLAKLTV